MSRTTKIAIAALGALLIGFFIIRGLTSGSRGGASVDEKSAESQSSSPAPKRASSESSAPSPAEAAPALVDDDPIGNLRLEGQVVDENDEPVGGATVILGSSPPKSSTSEEDGSFFFESLVSRRYPVYARSTERVGGPVFVTLSASTDPVVIRIRAGGGIEVEVVDAKDQPIQGALVHLPAMDSVREETDEKGIAILRNLPPGHTFIAASAPGYARATSLAMVPRKADTLGRQRLSLQKGVKVSGTVVDHEGKALANAHVIARSVGAILQTQDPRRDGATSDADGHFELPAVPSGVMQLFAVHDEQAPTTGERFTVGESDMQGIDLKMREGASVAGRVVNQSGEAVPWATVRVLSPADLNSRGGSTNRQRIAEEDGSFEIKGLPRDQLLVYGSSESASSEGLEIDLRAKARAEKLNLVLSLEGQIQGIVLDQDGEPVAEAQVQAFPDFWEGADIDQMRVRGPSFATTAGDGSFTLRGLPESKYRLRASRDINGGFGAGTQGVAAKTGDSNVRLVLASPGEIVGEIRLSDGSTPETATVTIGYGAGVPSTDGHFVLRDVPPGNYELAVRGPNFAATFRSKVELSAGETLDIGTITVQKGRTVRGRVLSMSGQPLAGAEVVLARQLVSDGSSLTPRDLGDAMDNANETRRTTSDQSGQYALYGIGEAEWTLASDHPEAGRSIGQKVEAGTEDRTLDLRLGPVGSVRGKVSVNGEARPGIQILLTATASEGQHLVLVTSDERGAFYAERVSAGEHKVSAMMGSGGSSSMAATTVTVEPGQEAEAVLEIEEGAVTVLVQVSGEDGAKIDAAQVFLFKGVAKVQSGGELNKLFLSAASSAKMGFAFSKGEAKFEKVNAGAYSVCVIPINGDMNDPAFAQKLQRNVADIAVYCERLEVAEAPKTQSHSAVVPPMNPLPEE